MADDSAAAPPPPVEDAPIISETGPEVSSAINAAPGGATLPTGDAGSGQLPTNAPAPAESGQQATAPVAAGSGQPSPGTASSPKGGPGQLTSYTNVGTPGSQQVNVDGGGGKINSPSAKGSSYQVQQGFTPPTPTPQHVPPISWQQA